MTAKPSALGSFTGTAPALRGGASFTGTAPALSGGASFTGTAPALSGGASLRDPLVLALVAAGTFARGIGNGFVSDDYAVIRESLRMRELSSAYGVFLHPSTWIISDRTDSHLMTYRPLAVSSMVIDNALFGGAPAGFHATNVLLHAVCVVLFWLLLRRVGIGAAVSFGLALIFAVHPVAAEAITWINGRSEPMCLVFGLATLALCTRESVLTIGAMAAIAAALCMSLLGKETGVIFFVLAFGVLLRRRDRDTLRAGGFALLAGAALYALFRTAALSGAQQHKLSVSMHVLSAVPAIWARALQVVLIPVDLGLENLLAWLHTTTPVQLVAFVLLGAAFVSATLIAWLRGRTLEAIGLAWWLAALGPPSLTLATGAYWPGLSRWVYVALPGLLLALAPWLERHASRRGAYAGSALLALPLVFASQREITLWKSDEALLQHMIARYPNEPLLADDMVLRTAHESQPAKRKAPAPVAK